MFKKFIYIFLWLCILSGTASTAVPPGAARSPAASSAASTPNP
jgi:hypothetical protein